jgi:transporter family-2 protein
VLIGVELGPNLSVTDSLATILWLIALRENYARLSAHAVVGGLWPFGGRGAGLCGVDIDRQKWVPTYRGFTVTAPLDSSLVVDNYGWFRMEHHPVNIWRILGVLMVGGVTLRSKF